MFQIAYTKQRSSLSCEAELDSKKYVHVTTSSRTFPRKSFSLCCHQIHLDDWHYSLSDLLSTLTTSDCRASQVSFYIFVLVLLVDRVIFSCVRCSENDWRRMTPCPCEEITWLITKKRKRKLLLLSSSSSRREQSDVTHNIRTTGNHEIKPSTDGRMPKQGFQSRAFDDCASEVVFSYSHILA